MNSSLSNLEQYDKLVPITQKLFEHTSHLAWQMLLPLFLLSIAISYSSDLGIAGSILVRLKRIFIIALLLTAFPMMAEFLQTFGVEIAKSIDDLSGLDMILDAASKKAESYSINLTALLNLDKDFFIGGLSIVSFVILLIARYFLLAFQHFYWLLLIVLAPFMILALLFDSSVGVTKNLFKNLIQISCWPIIWAILSAFLKVTPFSTAYTTDADYLTIITLNLILAVSLLYSPFIISQLCEGAALSVGEPLKRGVIKTLAMTNPKTSAVYTTYQKINPPNQNKNFKAKT